MWKGLRKFGLGDVALGMGELGKVAATMKVKACSNNRCEVGLAGRVRKLQQQQIVNKALVSAIDTHEWRHTELKKRHASIIS
jgi:hypothetical protein